MPGEESLGEREYLGGPLLGAGRTSYLQLRPDSKPTIEPTDCGNAYEKRSGNTIGRIIILYFLRM